MATPVSDTLREGEVRLEVEKPPNPHIEVDQEMDDDSAGEGEALLDLQEGPSRAREREETSGHTSGEEDNRSHVGPEPSSHPKTDEKPDFVLVYKTWKMIKAGRKEKIVEYYTDKEGRKEVTDHFYKRETFEKNLKKAGLDIIETKDTEAPDVSSLSL